MEIWVKQKLYAGQFLGWGWVPHAFLYLIDLTEDYDYSLHTQSLPAVYAPG